MRVISKTASGGAQGATCTHSLSLTHTNTHSLPLALTLFLSLSLSHTHVHRLWHLDTSQEYEGDFKNGERWGAGRDIGIDKTMYLGDFKDGVRDGWGTGRLSALSIKSQLTHEGTRSNDDTPLIK